MALKKASSWLQCRLSFQKSFGGANGAAGELFRPQRFHQDLVGDFKRIGRGGHALQDFVQFYSALARK